MGYAPVVSACAAIIAGCIVIWVHFGKPYLRRRKLRYPTNVKLVDVARNKCDALKAPAHSVCAFQLQLGPRHNYREDLLRFGFEGEIGSKPFAIRTNNAFVLRGTKTESPDDTKEHALDVGEFYHIKRTVQRTRGNFYEVGFDVQTRGPGKFKVFLQFMTEEGHAEIDTDLYLIVEDQPANPAISSSDQT